MSATEKTVQNRRPPLVLVIDDQEWSARAFESVLSPHGYSVIRCRSARQTLEHIQTISPDALLIKADLPDSSGSELCRTLREQAHVSANTPVFIASTAPLRRNQRLEAIGSGAWDLISLPVDAEELLLRLGVYVRSKFEADRAREESLLDLASGLYSIHGLLRRVRELSLDAYRYHSPIACVVIGLEDEWAPPAAGQGSEGYAAWADRLVRLINGGGRRSDVIRRLSQAEFVVVAPRTGSEGVLKLAQRIHEAAELLHEKDGGESLRISV